MQLFLYIHILCALILFLVVHSNGQSSQSSPVPNELMSLFSNEINSKNTNIQTIENTYSSTFSSFQNTNSDSSNIQTQDPSPESYGSSELTQNQITSYNTFINTQTFSTAGNPNDEQSDSLYFPQTANPLMSSTANGQSSTSQQNQNIPINNYGLTNDGIENTGYGQDLTNQFGSTYPNSQSNYPYTDNSGLSSDDSQYLGDKGDSNYILPQTANPNPYLVNGGNEGDGTYNYPYENSQTPMDSPDYQMDYDYYQSYLNSLQNAQPNDNYMDTGSNNGLYGATQSTDSKNNAQGYDSSGLNNDMYGNQNNLNGNMEQGYYNPNYNNYDNDYYYNNDFTGQYPPPTNNGDNNQLAGTYGLSATNGGTSNKDSQSNNQYQPNSQPTSVYPATGVNQATNNGGNNQLAGTYGLSATNGGTSNKNGQSNNEYQPTSQPTTGVNQPSSTNSNSGSSESSIVTQTITTTYIVQGLPDSDEVTPMPLMQPNIPSMVPSTNENAGDSSEDCEDDESNEESDSYFVYDPQGNIIGINHKDSSNSASSDTGISGSGYGSGYGVGGNGYNGMVGGTIGNSPNAMDQLGQDVKNVSYDAAGNVINAADKAYNATQNVGNDIKNSDTAQALGTLGGDVANATKDAAKHVGNTVDDAASKTINGIDQAGGDLYNAGKTVGGAVKNGTADAVNGVSNAAVNAADATKNAGTDVYQDTKGFGDNLGSDLKNDIVGDDEDTASQ